MSRIHRLVPLMSIIVGVTAWGERSRAQEVTSHAAPISEADASRTAQQWAGFVSEANVSALEKLLNDRYVHIHATALVESKTQFLEALKNGSRKYDPVRFEETVVRTFGGSAVVTGRFNLKSFSRGRTVEGVNRFTLVLVKTQDGQQVVSFQATPIPPPAK